MALKVGYDIFAAPTQAGSTDATPGLLLAETVASGKHKVRLVRSQDGKYYNATTGVWDAGATAEADELNFAGSFSPSGPANGSSVRRLKMRLPNAVVAAVTSGTLAMTVYASGGAVGTTAVTVPFSSL